MALSKEQYKVFEDIVGPENISDDPVILDGGHSGPTGFSAGFYLQRPPAVILPGSTEDVQAIMKAINRYGLQANVSSSGWGCLSGTNALSKDMIVLDMRRMNRILEIDEKNMCAVVEPYVSAGQLQGVLEKLGFSAHCTGAGPTQSVLASAAAFGGMGFDSIFMSYSGRNVLGVEWVTPTGEVARIGSRGSGQGWFYPDSPGVSVWGTLRGGFGTSAGLGVFTKCATKIYPWPGEGEEHTGVSPTYLVEKYPEKLKAYYLAFPSYERMAEAVYKISEANIGYMLNRIWGAALPFVVADSNDEVWALLQTGVFQERCKYGFAFSLGAFSSREIEYQEKTLMKILEETEGDTIDDLLDLTPAGRSRLYYHLSWNAGSVAAVFKAAGAFLAGVSYIDTTDACIDGTKISTEVKKEYGEKGVLLDDGDAGWGVAYEGGMLSGLHTEQIWQWDPSEAESVAGCFDYMVSSIKPWADRGFSMFWGLKMGPFAELYGPAATDYQMWLKRIKREFDPKAVANPVFYVTTAGLE
ncbi:MAG: FAD-binding oxidoreductase [Actinomycetota bacterium]|nr:FAD-binding oxidoreductase [Actinomycetota bacterium]